MKRALFFSLALILILGLMAAACTPSPGEENNAPPEDNTADNQSENEQNPPCPIYDTC